MTLIAIEGVDSAGKNTQIQRLYKRLKAEMPTLSQIESFDFPHYDSPSGQAILGLLKGEWTVSDQSVRALVLQSLMTTNRFENSQLLSYFTTQPWEDANRKILVLDRYYISGLVYGQADGLSLEYLLDIHKLLPVADLHLLLDIPVEESMRRRPVRRDNYEADIALLSRARAAYLEIFKTGQRLVGGKWHVINGMQPEDDIHEQIFTLVMECV